MKPLGFSNKQVWLVLKRLLKFLSTRCVDGRILGSQARRVLSCTQKLWRRCVALSTFLTNPAVLVHIELEITYLPRGCTALSPLSTNLAVRVLWCTKYCQRRCLLIYFCFHVLNLTVWYYFMIICELKERFNYLLF